jgi:predicted phage terminase large subunit-like protein
VTAVATRHVGEQLARSPHVHVLADGELRRRKLHAYVKGAWPTLEPARAFIDNWHIGHVCEHLEAAKRRELKFIVINVPPGTMKSLLVNVMFPSWTWTDAPHERFLCLGAADDLPTRDSLKCRRLIESNWYQERYGHVYQLTSDQNAKTKYETDKSGVRGIGSFSGSILGERAGFILVDDPHKTELAESDDVREGKLVKFREEVYSRREDENSVVIIVMQRLHERDLAGFVLAEGYADAHICIPMRFEERRKLMVQVFPVKQENADPRKTEGELLDQNRFPEHEVAKTERILGPWGTAAQHQQRPSPRGGGIVKREDFRFCKRRDWPARFDLLGLSTDAAFKDTDASSFVVNQVWGRLGADSYLCAQVRDRMSFTKTLDSLRDLRKNRFPGAQVMLVEDKANGPAIIDTFKREIPGVLPIEPLGSKPARAEAAAVLICSHNVVLPDPEEEPWVEAFISEWCAVPKNAFWDQVDASAQWLLKFGFSVAIDAASVMTGTPLVSSTSKYLDGMAAHPRPAVEEQDEAPVGAWGGLDDMA